MFGAGILGFAGAFLPDDRAKILLLVLPLTAATVIPYVMSYVWFRQISRE